VNLSSAAEVPTSDTFLRDRLASSEIKRGELKKKKKIWHE